jgi:hypothetical protein
MIRNKLLVQVMCANLFRCLRLGRFSFIKYRRNMTSESLS